MESFKLKVVTPAGIAFEEEVTSATVPTELGEITVLPNHVEYNGILAVGILSFTPASTEPGAGSAGAVKRVVVAGGFVQNGEEGLVVLADSYNTAEQVDANQYGARRSELQKLVDTGDSSTLDWRAAREQLSRIEAIDRLIAQ